MSREKQLSTRRREVFLWQEVRVFFSSGSCYSVLCLACTWLMPIYMILGHLYVVFLHSEEDKLNEGMVLCN